MANQSGFDIYRAIIKPLRDADDTLLLKRFLAGPQDIHDQSEVDILGLPDQLKPDKVKLALLPYLLALVGFTSELRSITDRLTEQQLRRLVRVAVPLWKQRHTKPGLINAIRLLTGRAAIVADWFQFRAILGEVSLTEDQLVSGGDFWIIGGAVSAYDEFFTNIRLMDDGTLDELLLLDVIKLMRPLDERFEIFIDDFLDHFDAVLDKWTQVGGSSIDTAAIIDSVTFASMQVMKLLPTKTAQPVILLLPTSTQHHDYNVAFKINIPAGGSFTHRWYTTTSSGGTGYQLDISGTTGLGTLTRFIGGVGTTLQAAAAWPLVCKLAAGVWYTVRISTVNLDTNTRSVRVLIDGNQAVPASPLLNELVDASGGTGPSSGPYMFINASGSLNLWLDNVESWRNPARFATIGLSSITDRGGVVTMTSNFVQ